MRDESNHSEIRPIVTDSPAGRILRAAGMLLFAVLAGCASYGVIDNKPVDSMHTGGYSLSSFVDRAHADENVVMLAFSGGGTRAAALSYGVLQTLRDTLVTGRDGDASLLDDVDAISAVSGGSFTAAYYGLYGDRIFEDFEKRFLRRNVEGALISGIFNPFHWFSRTGRTELAVRYYEDEVFGDATFADMLARPGPMILLNASDLGYGARFTFIQEYFNLLCSDISSFPVARAVTASSAVPLLFNPVVLANHDNCEVQVPPWLEQLRQLSQDDAELELSISGLESYLDKEGRRFAHFVDGGITDNLGLRAIYDIITYAGGPAKLSRAMGRENARRLVLISVNASTSPAQTMDQSNRMPSFEASASAMSGVQLHRYNAATLNLMRRTVRNWAAETSTPEKPVEAYFIEIDFSSLRSRAESLFASLNLIPTSFSLSDEQVDQLIEVGRTLLRDHPTYQQLVKSLRGTSAAATR